MTSLNLGCLCSVAVHFRPGNVKAGSHVQSKRKRRSHVERKHKENARYARALQCPKMAAILLPESVLPKTSSLEEGLWERD